MCGGGQWCSGHWADAHDHLGCLGLTNPYQQRNSWMEEPW